MGQYNIAYRLFHIGIFVCIVITYAILSFYIIPRFIAEKDQPLVERYTGYAFTIGASLLTLGSMVSEYIDERMEAKTLKAGRR